MPSSHAASVSPPSTKSRLTKGILRYLRRDAVFRLDRHVRRRGPPPRGRPSGGFLNRIVDQHGGPREGDVQADRAAGPHAVRGAGRGALGIGAAFRLTLSDGTGARCPAARAHRSRPRTSRRSRDGSAAAGRRRCATSDRDGRARPAATSRPASARSSSRSRCTTCSTRRATGSSGTSAIRRYPHKLLTGRRERFDTLRQRRRHLAAS